MKQVKLLISFTLGIVLFCGATQRLVAQDFFVAADSFFQQYVSPPNVAYAAIRQDATPLNQLLEMIATYQVETKGQTEQKAFWINAYNLLVIASVVDHYPIQSPKDIAGFFDRHKHLVAGENMTLNHLQNEKLLQAHRDARLHFALVCAARSCPPLLDEAYWPERLEEQLEMATRQAVNDSTFIRVGEKTVELSPIFRWYANDFGSIKNFLHRYLKQDLPPHAAMRYYPYDWRLNEIIAGKNFPLPFRASYLLQSGELEVKIFNSLYTQQSLDGFAQVNSRSTYFSSFAQFLFGSQKKWNWGFDLVYKSNVLNDVATRSPFRALRFQNFSEEREYFRNAAGDFLTTSGRIGLAHLGPKFKINPIRKWENLSWQQTFYVPIQHKVDGQWVSFSQFFYDRPIGTRFQLFSEISLWMTVAPQFRVFPAAKIFYSYFPTRRWTVYAMGSLPVEYGLGSKVQITPQLEVELLYTYYLPIAAIVGDVRPSTFNLGFRYRR